MITRLFIKNYAIIDELDIRFSDKLSIVTGETGAGKSIMLGALGLVIGKRADSRVLYNTEEKCVVEAHFNIADYDLREFFEENDLDYDNEVVIRREISTAGKSRAFVNDTPSTLDVVEKLADSLLDLHQQFDTLDIHDAGFQLRVIDALADNKELLKDYRVRYRAYSSTKNKLAKLREQSSRALQEMEFLQFQLEEFRTAELKAGEQDLLEAELAELTNAEEIKRATGGAFQALTASEIALCSQLTEVERTLTNISKFQPKVPALVERLINAIAEIEDISSELETIAEDTEYDGNRIADVQARLNLIYKLQKKHGLLTVEELIALQEDMEVRLKGFTNISEDIENLEAEVVKLELALRQSAAVLSQRRQAVIAGFETKVHALLNSVAMESARLEVEMKASEELLPTGSDKLRFLFAANKGSRMEDIKGTASGGELSRLAFCVKSLVAGAIPLPTMIFDEIDSGVSGEVSRRMGEIMQQLANERQVICITHSPQIAAKAHLHYFVYKKNTPERTLTGIRELAQDERVTEIAKMLSGDPPSEFAKQNARELMGI